MYEVTWPHSFQYFSMALKAFLSNIFKNPYSQNPLNTHLNGENIPISKG